MTGTMYKKGDTVWFDHKGNPESGTVVRTDGYFLYIKNENGEVDCKHETVVFKTRNRIMRYFGIVNDDTDNLAREAIRQLRDKSYNHAGYGTDMAIDTETAVSIIEEIFCITE